MKTDIWMPIYIGDYHKDTRHLSTVAHGCYFLILMELWVKGSVPLKRLERVCMRPENWDEIWEDLEEFFEIDKINLQVTQKRLLIEREKWGKFREAKQTAGSKGGRPKGSLNKPTGKPTGKPTANLQAKPSPSPSTAETISTKKDIVKKSISSFQKPSILEIKEYCDERNNGIDAVEFFYHYEANNWFRGKTKIKSWKACVITWEKSNKNKPQQGARANGTVKSFSQQSDDNYSEIKKNTSAILRTGEVSETGLNPEEPNSNIPTGQRAIESGEGTGPDNDMDGGLGGNSYELSGELLQISEEEQSDSEDTQPTDGSEFF